ncbi:hypothetical protein LUZ60_015193 [Juncus effusus]|nr:hypothetical protein LUZ60_015193 [Juncus effusus]
MAEEYVPTNPVKNEGGDIDGNAPIAGMKKEAADSDDEDEVPLAVARAGKKSAIAASSSSAKVKKEESAGSKSGVLKENSSKKIGESSNSKSSKVKKEETEDLKKKSVVKNTKPSKVKKLDSEDEKETKKKTVKKAENKGKENKKQKKSYDLPGQKHDPPEERDPLRIFYESLYHQIPTSEMAAFWMMERGLLEEAEAKRVFEKKRQKNGQLASPVKPVSNRKSTPVNGTTSKGKTVNSKDDKGKTVKKRKAAESDEDSDDDFIASRKISASKKLKV